ncbi:GNAT family N-acetyltransferase [Sphingomonas sp. FW199]|uniref:GNAT family N-acetyltransferase n=1 Tax=Sphingomonas sp. FW199 TaxID=3400217 RepID=UPI003CEBFF77
MSIVLREGGLDDAAVVALLRVHAEGMLTASPPGSCHFLDLSGLKQPDVRFFSAWAGDRLAGIGALKRLDAGHGELKSMRVAEAFLGQGVGRAMLEHLIATAQAMGMTQLSLETGSTAPFAPALAMYAAHGFEPCGAFGDYRDGDPFSRFLTRAI